MTDLANPRQRRKQRSGTAKNSISKASKKNKNKVVVRGPEMLVKGWDKHKTVHQNYRALGLLAKLDPRQAGGIEPVEAVPFALQQQTNTTMDSFLNADLDADSDEDDHMSDDDGNEEEQGAPPTASTSAAGAGAPAKLGPGMARIVRDETGKVIKIVMAGEDGKEVEEEIKKIVRDSDSDDDDDESSEDESAEADVESEAATTTSTPWGAPMTEWAIERGDALLEEVPVTGPRKTGQGISLQPRREVVQAKTAVVRELEAYAATDRGKVVRHTSEFEADWLVSMVAKHGEDVERMARDRKVNPWQRTQGEIKRQVAKAGGFSKLRAQLQRKLEQEAEQEE